MTVLADESKSKTNCKTVMGEFAAMYFCYRS